MSNERQAMEILDVANMVLLWAALGVVTVASLSTAV